MPISKQMLSRLSLWSLLTGTDEQENSRWTVAKPVDTLCGFVTMKSPNSCGIHTQSLTITELDRALIIGQSSAHGDGGKFPENN